MQLKLNLFYTSQGFTCTDTDIMNRYMYRFRQLEGNVTLNVVIELTYLTKSVIV